MYTQKTFTLKTADQEPKWYVVDAADKVLGRVATEVASVLRGKNNPKFTPNIDSGDFVIVVNAEKVKLTGNKLKDKVYYAHSRFVGGLRKRTAEVQLEKDPTFLITNAVKGMLPKTSLGRKQLTKLKVFAGENHSHESQKPVELKL